eukprot:scaffold8113_cov67-Phaeocystis_antarctica.AAC.2
MGGQRAAGKRVASEVHEPPIEGAAGAERDDAAVGAHLVRVRVRAWVWVGVRLRLREAAVGAERQQPCVRCVLLRLKRAEAVGDQAHQERPATRRDERAVKESFSRRPFLLEAGRAHPRPRVPGLAGRVRRQAHAVDHAVAVEPASLLRGVLGLRIRPILQNGSTREVGR